MGDKQDLEYDPRARVAVADVANEDTETEIAMRSAEWFTETEQGGNVWHKRFRITTDSDHLEPEDHEQNHKAVLSEAINHGVHPKGDVELVSEDAKLVRRGSGNRHVIDVVYSVPVELARLDENAGDTIAPSRPEGAEPQPDDMPAPTSKAKAEKPAAADSGSGSGKTAGTADSGSEGDRKGSS